MATAFMGYCLVYGQMSHWGATVITNLLSAIPFVGNDIVPFIWGGFSVSNPTIQRFFALHYLLPFVLAALVVLHLIALHVHGSSNPVGITGNLDRLSFHPYFVFKDLITVFVWFFFFCFFVFFSPNTLGQWWPFIILPFWLMLIMHYTICWKYSLHYNKTINVSGFYSPFKVKYYYNEYNQQITNVINLYTWTLFRYLNNIYLWSKINILVGISETIRVHKLLTNIIRKNSTLINFNNSKIKNEDNEKLLSLKLNIDSDTKFNQWLAGLIDADGYLYLASKKYPTLEITTCIEDEKMLRQIQNKFGGSIKPRSGSNSIRYRLSKRENMIKLLNAINGNIRNTKRITQFIIVCNALNIKVKDIEILHFNHAWFSGFFDGDGTINYYYQNKRPQLFISVTNKYLVDVQPYQTVFGGKIYFDKSQNGYYKWTITSKDLHLLLYNYNKLCPSRSFKGNKLFLIKSFYKFYDIKAYDQNHNSILYKSWLKFELKWKSYSYK